jgi:hypothetical protein
MTERNPSGDIYGRDKRAHGYDGRCARCGGVWTSEPTDNPDVGYALMDLGNGRVIVCYKCCALYDKEWMREHGSITLYINPYKATCKVTHEEVTRYHVTNWPGSLKFKCHSWSASKTNWNHERIDVWFRFDEEIWWGVHIGHNNNLVHCRRTKKKA